MQVTALVPTSANPHIYEPTPSQVKEVAQARLVVANGAGLDKWVVDKLVRPNNLSVSVFQAADVVAASLIPTPMGPDPHIWVDPGLMARVVPSLAEALAKADPAGKALYQARAQRLEKALLDLDKEVANRLKVRTKPGVIALRNPFRYFTLRYQIPILYVVVPNPEAPEATAKAVAEPGSWPRKRGSATSWRPFPPRPRRNPWHGTWASRWCWWMPWGKRPHLTGTWSSTWPRPLPKPSASKEPVNGRGAWVAPAIFTGTILGI